ncbi:tRNA-specific 2-thiouridylase [Candidatus Saccharibacteria bacterium]|nr:tRNA-specific 2-thiouridylase [Candidatus Saccharibacteria bacterium]
MPLGDGSLAPVVTGLAPSSSVVTSGSPSRHRFQSSAPTVFVGMSGGVDSSVAAMLLVEQGYDVTGVYMKNWSQDLPGMKCPWADDLADAKRVAVKLGIPFEVWDFEKEYREKVVEYMLAEFKKGNTPNPDIMCNQEIKFKLFFEKAMERGADFIATGHYARTGVTDDFCRGGSGAWQGEDERQNPCGDRGFGRAPEQKLSDRTPVLVRAVDENKDQTYFLYRISDEALARTLFPIGDMLKPEVKKLAEEKGLHNAYKKESMGVCFVGEVGMKDFLKEYIDTKPGEIRRVEDDKVLGVHEGAVFYTIGQRHGLYLDGEKGTVNDGLPYYVVKKDIAKNIVYVSKNLNDGNLWVDELELKELLFRSGPRPAGPSPRAAGANSRAAALRNAPSQNKSSSIQVRLRHRAPLIPAEFDGKKLKFASKIKRPASGQSAVIYAGEICLGGGFIA